jgi:hypothetical protein
MNIYCAHPGVVPYGPGGYLMCPLCDHDWYAQDPAPLVIIGVTSSALVDRYPFTLINGRWEKL